MGTELEFKSLTPEGVKNFKKTGQMQLFDRKNLFDYMNGGAELYLSYDFQKLIVQEYKSKDRAITVEIYEMKTSQDAFGLFSLDQQGNNLAIGDKANYASGLLKFWRRNHFIRIMDLNGNDQFKEVIVELGKMISSKIDMKGELPFLLSKLPAEGLILNSERFFHKQIVLNNLYFLSTENLLNLSEKTSAVMGDYLLGKMNLKLLLISYPDTSSAKAAYENFCTKYLKSSPVNIKIIQKIEKDKFIGIEREKNFLWITFEGKDEKKTENILENVKENLK